MLSAEREAEADLDINVGREDRGLCGNLRRCHLRALSQYTIPNSL